MRFQHLAMASILCGAMGSIGAEATAQQATVSTPMNSVSDSFFERIGTNWGFNWNGVHARFGGGNMALPQFGRYDPSAGLHGGFGVRGPGGSGFLNFGMAQGSRRSAVSQTPSITLMNGRPGFFSDTSQSPFVIGYIPVVGGFPTIRSLMPAPLPVVDTADRMAPSQYSNRVQTMRRLMADRAEASTEQPVGDGVIEGAAQRHVRAMAHRPPEPAAVNVPTAPAVGRAFEPNQTSSATRAVPSVAEARRLRELERQSQNTEALVYWERGQAAEKAGKPNVATIHYRMALKRATGELRRQVLHRLEEVGS